MRKFYVEERLEAVLVENKHKTVESVFLFVKKNLMDFVRTSDDISFVIIKRQFLLLIK